MKKFFTILLILSLTTIFFTTSLLVVKWWKAPSLQVYIPPKALNLTNPVKANRALYDIKLNGKFGCMDILGKLAIDTKFDNIKCSTDELIPFELNDKWGFINQSGEIILEPQFNLIGTGNSTYFSEGLAIVCMNDKCGYIDSSGNYILKPIYDYAENFSEGVAKVYFNKYDLLGNKIQNSESIYINKEGKPLFPDSGFIPLSEFSDGLAKVEVGKKQVFIDKLGQIILDPKEINMTSNFQDGLALYSHKEVHRYGYADKNGQIIIPAQFKQAGDFQEGLAQVMFENGKYGFIDKTGKTIIEPQFEYADSFYEGRAVIRVDGKFGYLDKEGKIVIPIQFCSVERFVNGLARVSFDDQNLPSEKRKSGYIDKLGNFVWQPTN